jgi:aryl-phospho-beta-D-glucosidase BglC (GH1 family)
VVALVLCGACFAGQKSWGPCRGANASPRLSEQDVADLAALGANIVRPNFNALPLMQKTPPYDFNEAAFERLDQITGYCEKHRIGVVVDPHTTPGTERTTTTSPNDAFWKEPEMQELLVKLWDKIARRYRDRGSVIAGHDLLNEPSLPNGGAAGTLADWNALVRRLIKAIRAADKTHAIIIEPPTLRMPDGKMRNRLEGMDYLERPPDDNVVYSPHMYEPHAFTHQGVQGRPQPFPYPGKFGNRNWDRAEMERVLEPVAAFQKKYGAPIFMGEFSAPRWCGEDGNRYLRDVIEICEKNGWSWAYHSFREWEGWDAERSNTDKNDRQRYPSTPRLELLKSFLSRNENH